MRSRIQILDQAFLLASNRIRAGRWRPLELLLLGFSRAGDGYLWGLLLFFAFKNGRNRAAWAGLMAASAAMAISLLLKRACQRPRPADGLGWGKILAPDQFSFPSGHTSAAFAIALVADGFWHAISLPVWFAAAGIAASRTLLGFHYLSDVLAGGVLGLLCGLSISLVLS